MNLLDLEYQRPAYLRAIRAVKPHYRNADTHAMIADIEHDIACGSEWWPLRRDAVRQLAARVGIKIEVTA
jgi:hypothetical protein